MLLPEKMRSDEGLAMITAIGLQESRFIYRTQLGGGPAHGFWQFEKIAVEEVMTNNKTIFFAKEVCSQLKFNFSVDCCYDLISVNDALASAYARLLLWMVPDSLPEAWDRDKAWNQYIKAWKPGKPRPETWGAHYELAWKWVYER